MAGVYISFPFCSQKCTYCNFASGVFPAELEARYLDALSAQIRSTEWPWTPETVYIGGGTPSVLEPERFRGLLEHIPGVPWREATIEAAPGSLTAEKVAMWSACGINRVSLGVQSFVEKELRRTGRKHTAAIVESDVTLLRAHGIGNISVDLIAGLSGQTAAGWQESLGWLAALDVPHVSAYMLEVDEDSRLGKELTLGGVRYGAGDVPGESDIVAFYESAVRSLAARGIERYEISNFARPGYESLHNLKYWRLEPYLGFGSDAHSFDGMRRWQNAEMASEYVAKWTDGESVVTDEMTPDHREERFFVGLRLSEGIVPSTDEWQHFAEPIERFLSDGLLEREGDRLRLTSRGVLLSNEVFGEFIETCP